MPENDKPEPPEGGRAEPSTGQEEPAAREAIAGELVSHSPTAGPLMPLPAEQVVEGMRAYQRLLKELLEPSDWQTRDKDGNKLPTPFLKKCGWRKIARAFNLSFERVHSQVERDEDGRAVRAEVWIRAVAPNGQYGDGDGYCSADEGRFRSWRGRQKLENDLRTTATTRAKNRAIADLVGMGEVSAEEVAPAGDEEEHARAVAAGARASDELAQLTLAALALLIGDREPDRDTAKRIAERIAHEHGYLPVAAGRALCHAATARAAVRRKRHATSAGARPAPDSPAGADELDYWQKKARYGDELMQLLTALVFGESATDQLNQDQRTELGFLIECAVRGKVSERSLSGWLAELASRADGRHAEALRSRLVEKANQVELTAKRAA